MARTLLGRPLYWTGAYLIEDLLGARDRAARGLARGPLTWFSGGRFSARNFVRAVSRAVMGAGGT